MMFLLLIPLISSALFCNALSNAIDDDVQPEKNLPFEDCGSVYEIDRVVVSSCYMIPCYIPVPGLVYLTIQFEKSVLIKSDLVDLFKIRHEVYWILNNVRTKADVEPDNENGLADSLKVKIRINATMPAIRGTLFWTSKDFGNKQVICFKIAVDLKVATAADFRFIETHQFLDVRGGQQLL